MARRRGTTVNLQPTRIVYIIFKEMSTVFSQKVGKFLKFFWGFLYFERACFRRLFAVIFDVRRIPHRDLESCRKNDFRVYATIWKQDDGLCRRDGIVRFWRDFTPLNERNKIKNIPTHLFLFIYLLLLLFLLFYR